MYPYGLSVQWACTCYVPCTSTQRDASFVFQALPLSICPPQVWVCTFLALDQINTSNNSMPRCHPYSILTHHFQILTINTSVSKQRGTLAYPDCHLKMKSNSWIFFIIDCNVLYVWWSGGFYRQTEFQQVAKKTIQKTWLDRSNLRKLHICL